MGGCGAYSSQAHGLSLVNPIKFKGVVGPTACAKLKAKPEALKGRPHFCERLVRLGMASCCAVLNTPQVYQHGTPPSIRGMRAGGRVSDLRRERPWVYSNQQAQAPRRVCSPQRLRGSDTCQRRPADLHAVRGRGQARWKIQGGISLWWDRTSDHEEASALPTVQSRAPLSDWF